METLKCVDTDKQALRKLFEIPDHQTAIIVITHHRDSEEVGSWGPFSVRENAEQCIVALTERTDIERAIIVVVEPIEP